MTLHGHRVRMRVYRESGKERRNAPGCTLHSPPPCGLNATHSSTISSSLLSKAMAAATGTQHLLVSGRVLQWKDGMECPTAEVS